MVSVTAAKGSSVRRPAQLEVRHGAFEQFHVRFADTDAIDFDEHFRLRRLGRIDVHEFELFRLDQAHGFRDPSPLLAGSCGGFTAPPGGARAARA